MNRCSEYKRSGVEWIGKIPVSWEVKRIKRISIVRRGASPRPIDDPKYFDTDGEWAWVRIADISASKKYLKNTSQTLSELGSSLSVKIEPGSIFLSIAGTVGKPIISTIKCCIHDGFVYFSNLKVNPEYLYYIFVTGLPYQGLGKLGTQLNLNTDTVGDIYIPIPNKEEKKHIVHHLNKKTSQIDSLVEKIERKIELLKEQRTSLINQCVTKGLNPDVEMKNSGVDWIGEIPNHWRIQRLATLGEFSKGKNITKSDLRSSGYPCILYSQIYTEYNRITSETVSFIDKGLFLNSSTISRGTFLFTSSGESVDEIGKCILYFGEKDISIGGDVLVYQLKINACFDLEFLSFVFNSTYCQFYKSANSRGEIVVHIYGKQLRDLQIVFPPEISEQSLISQYLDKKTSQIDFLIEKEGKRIELLKEYRQSLISNVVTGKMRITEEMI